MTEEQNGSFRKCNGCGKEVPKGEGYKDTFNSNALTCLDCVCDEECT